MRALLLLLLASCASPASPSPAVDAALEAAVDSALDAAVAGPPIEADFAGVRAPFERAFYGVRDGVLHVEAHHGGSADCPTMTSPTPDRTLVIAGLPEGFTTTRTYADGVRVSLLDFKGTLTKEPILRATAVTVSEPSARADALGFTLDATFPGGSIKGVVHASHCPSLD